MQACTIMQELKQLISARPTIRTATTRVASSRAPPVGAHAARRAPAQPVLQPRTLTEYLASRATELWRSVNREQVIVVAVSFGIGILAYLALKPGSAGSAGCASSLVAAVGTRGVGCLQPVFLVRGIHSGLMLVPEVSPSELRLNPVCVQACNRRFRRRRWPVGGCLVAVPAHGY
jgi:hypothetical protein